VRTVRALLFAAALNGLMPSIAEACSIAFERRDGESEEQAVDRWFRAREDEFWANSDVVFVGDVVTLRRLERDLMVEVQPLVALKGDIGSELIEYRLDDDQAGAINCGRQSLPTVVFPGIFYARREPSGELRIDGMLNPEDVRDEALVARFFEAIEMTPFPLGAPEPEPPSLLERWEWLAGIALSLLAGGILIGRRSRKNISSAS
jgi:hypothetical protein